MMSVTVFMLLGLAHLLSVPLGQDSTLTEQARSIWVREAIGFDYNSKCPWCPQSSFFQSVLKYYTEKRQPPGTSIIIFFSSQEAKTLSSLSFSFARRLLPHPHFHPLRLSVKGRCGEGES